MTLSDSVVAVAAVFRRKPGDILPWYFLGAAVPAIARLVPFLALVVGFVYLETTGRLTAIQEELTAIDTDPPDPEADPDAFDEWVSGLEPAFELLFSPAMIALVAITVVLTVLIGILLYAFVAAGQLSACGARLRDERGLTAGLEGGRRYWVRFLGLLVLEFLLWIAVLLTVGLGTTLAAGVLVATGGAPIAILVGLFGGLVALLAVAAIRAVFAFAPVAIVVDDVSAVGSLSNAVGFVRYRPIQAGFYYLVAVGTTVAVAALSSLLMIVEVTAFVSLLTVLLVFPALDLLKTALYTDGRGRLAPPAIPERSLRGQFRDGIGRGWNEMVSFVRQTVGIHVLVVVLAVASFWVGWEAAEPIAGTFETSISARLEGHIAPAAALEFFGNNWLVAIVTALSGLVLVLPAIASLLFNGLVMGVYARTEAEPMELLAFVIPHGIFEIPAIFIATALGIWLGVAGWRTYRGHATLEELADALERAFWILVGVGLLLAVAGFIEGFVSPYYFRLFL